MTSEVEVPLARLFVNLILSALPTGTTIVGPGVQLVFATRSADPVTATVQVLALSSLPPLRPAFCGRSSVQ
jgi:hypothetical protein